MINEQKNFPFDRESINLLDSLPKRKSIYVNLLSLLRFLGIVILGFGGIGLIQVIMPIFRENDTTETGAFLLNLLIVSCVLAIGSVLYFIAEHFLFKEAPLGSLWTIFFEGISREKKNYSKIIMILESICKQTNEDKIKSIPRLFARALALEMRAEICEHDSYTKAHDLAVDAIKILQHLKTLGVNTPLLHFELATSYKIIKENSKAIESYKTYMVMYPEDKETQSILNKLSSSI